MRICFIGDSFVNGTGDPHCLGWVGRIGARARHAGRDLTVYNLGVRRDTSADIAARWPAEATARQPEDSPGLLVFSFGVNDCVEEAAGRLRVPPADTLANARAILSAAARRHPTLMVGPPPIDDEAVNARIAALSEALARVCAPLDVPYLDVFTPLVGHAVWRRETALGDGAHPGAAGYEALADLVWAWPAWHSAMAG